jgi:cell division protein FtsL
MRGQPGVLRLALAFAGLLASLSLVVWRQSRALEALRALDLVRQERAVLETERSLLTSRIQRLESRNRVVSVAGARLGLRIPVGGEIVVLPFESNGAGARQ